MGILKDEYRVGQISSTPVVPGPGAISKPTAPVMQSIPIQRQSISATPSTGYNKLQTNFQPDFLTNLLNSGKSLIGDIGAGIQKAAAPIIQKAAPVVQKVMDNPIVKGAVANATEKITTYNNDNKRLGELLRKADLYQQGKGPPLTPAEHAEGKALKQKTMDQASSLAFGATSAPVEVGGAIPAAAEAFAKNGTVKGLIQGAQDLATKILPSGEKTLAAETAAARAAAADKALVQIPKEINLDFYRQIPLKIKSELGIATKAIRDILKGGGTIPTPAALESRMTQIQQGGISVSNKLTKFATRQTPSEIVPNAPPSGIAGTIQNLKTGVDEVMKNLAYQSSKVVEKQGPYGKLLAAQMNVVRDTAEREAGTLISRVGSILKNFTPEEDKQLVQLLDQGVTAASERVNTAGVQIRQMLDEIAKRAVDLGVQQTEIRGMGVKKGAFTKLENYFPHIFDKVDMLGQGQVRENILTNLVKSGRAADRASAIQLLDQFIRRSSPRRFGSLEFGRVADVPGWEQDPLKALATYFDRAVRRLNEVKMFGPNNERVFGGNVNGKPVTGIIQRIADSGGDTNFVERAFNRVHGPVAPTLATEKFYQTAGKAAGNFQVITKLGLGQITNAGQTLNTFVKAGVGPTFRALRGALSKSTSAASKDFALRSGTILDSVMQDAMDQAGGSAASKFLKATGFSTIEQLNRVVASNAGKSFAENSFKDILNGNGSSSAVRTLEQMGINLKKALSNGQLSEEDLLKAGQKMSEWTQFRVQAPDVPYLWSSPEGRLLTQFKNFSYKYAQFLKKDVVDEALKHANFKPLLRLVVFSQLIGEPLNDIKKLLRGQNPLQSHDPALAKAIGVIPERMWDNFSSVGALGIFTDMVQAAQFGRIPEFILGPSVGDTATAADAAYQASHGNFRPAAQEITRRVPVVGPLLKNVLLPSKKAGSSTKRSKHLTP